MASSSGSGGSGTTALEDDMGAAERRKRRMLSNRESARRSRMRKQKHLDELVAHAAHLRCDNGQILATINITTQNYLAVESQNSVLRTQIAELANRLNSLNEILSCINNNNNLNSVIATTAAEFYDEQVQIKQWPVATAADMFQYC